MFYLTLVSYCVTAVCSADLDDLRSLLLNGAYAGGFLHAFTQGDSLERCGQLGALCAGQIVTQLGARSQVSLPDLIKEHLN